MGVDLKEKKTIFKFYLQDVHNDHAIKTRQGGRIFFFWF